MKPQKETGRTPRRNSSPKEKDKHSPAVDAEDNRRHESDSSDELLSPHASKYNGHDNCSASLSVRQVDTVCGSHQYAVGGYTLARCMGTGARLCSDIFEVAGQLFRLEVFPAGVNADAHRYLSVYLTTPGTVNANHILYKIELVDQSGREQHVSESHMADDKKAILSHSKGVVAGFPKFIRTKFLLDNPDKYLADDVLIIRATVKVLKGWSSFPVTETASHTTMSPPAQYTPPRPVSPYTAYNQADMTPQQTYTCNCHGAAHPSGPSPQAPSVQQMASPYSQPYSTQFPPPLSQGPSVQQAPSPYPQPYGTQPTSPSPQAPSAQMQQMGSPYSQPYSNQSPAAAPQATPAQQVASPYPQQYSSAPPPQAFPVQQSASPYPQPYGTPPPPQAPQTPSSQQIANPYPQSYSTPPQPLSWQPSSAQQLASPYPQPTGSQARSPLPTAPPAQQMTNPYPPSYGPGSSAFSSSPYQLQQQPAGPVTTPTAYPVQQFYAPQYGSPTQLQPQSPYQPPMRSPVPQLLKPSWQPQPGVQLQPVPIPYQTVPQYMQPQQAAMHMAVPSQQGVYPMAAPSVGARQSLFQSTYSPVPASVPSALASQQTGLCGPANAAAGSTSSPMSAPAHALQMMTLMPSTPPAFTQQMSASAWNPTPLAMSYAQPAPAVSGPYWPASSGSQSGQPLVPAMPAAQYASSSLPHMVMSRA